MPHESSHLVTRDLNLFKKKRRVEGVDEMLPMTDNDLICINTGNETWTYAYDLKQLNNLVKIVLQLNQNERNLVKLSQKQDYIESFLLLPYRYPQRVPSSWPNS